MSHTPGAIRAAQVILDGEETIPTSYGRKSVDGIADLIDRETAAPALVAALTDVHNLIWEWRSTGKIPGFGQWADADETARAALWLAKGE